ncbi:MgtC/SapB family protein [Neobacillus sp. MM2021_6]|uniref:MgtC/SapB family protein n=1 Tax=Bacillaceae TaxID=186817 RepID=UPI00140A2003|nr:MULTISPECIES: MgtC/SapB family protein [Bacillaceae]MBO0958803.1 MgtC/SapB family protein [Neobacillus sp. MM2021_6]NHC20028.1 MgtC/SapB family protein [Bacillus sp. MM2020_4]WML41410.1 MgtC/SapB family protein [Neobacillus sp. OS1-2]
MDAIFSIARDYEMYIRVVVSTILGFLIGWDREAKNKPAGLKTYMYVCVASTLITLLSIYSVDKYGDMNSLTRMDPMRLTAQIVSGLGFLGAGVILKDGTRVKGLTSAAMILFAGGVGIGIGAGFYGIVIFSVFVSLLLARVASFVEKKKTVRLNKQLKDKGVGA